MASTSPTHLAFVVAAVTWPLAAGLGLVLWSKLRASARTRKLAAVESDLRSLYHNVERRGAPAHLTLVIDALEEGEALAGAGPRAGSPTPKATA